MCRHAKYEHDPSIPSDDNADHGIVNGQGSLQ